MLNSTKNCQWELEPSQNGWFRTLTPSKSMQVASPHKNMGSQRFLTREQLFQLPLKGKMNAPSTFC